MCWCTLDTKCRRTVNLETPLLSPLLGMLASIVCLR